MKTQLLKIVFNSVIILILMGCHFNGQYLNREEDKSEAEMITNQFYTKIKNQEFNESLALFSDKFFEYSDRQELLKILTATNNKLGVLQSTKLEKWDSRVIEGSDPSSNYTFLYINQYEKFEARETIGLIKDDDGIVRIVSYNIDSMGFME